MLNVIMLSVVMLSVLPLAPYNIYICMCIYIYVHAFSSEDLITLMIDILSNKPKYEDWDSFSEFILFSK